MSNAAFVGAKTVNGPFPCSFSIRPAAITTTSFFKAYLADDDEDDRLLFSQALIEVDESAILTEVENAFELGATFYAVKPNSFANLKSLIKNVLQMEWKYSGLIPNKKLVL